jgi:hypothetical protein
MRVYVRASKSGTESLLVSHYKTPNLAPAIANLSATIFLQTSRSPVLDGVDTGFLISKTIRMAEFVPPLCRMVIWSRFWSQWRKAH